MNKCFEMYKSIRFDINCICSCCTNKRGVEVKLNDFSLVDDVMNEYFDKVELVRNSIVLGGENIVSSCKGCYKLSEKTQEYSNFKIKATIKGSFFYYLVKQPR